MVKPNSTSNSSERNNNSSSSYRGVRKRKWGKYVSEIRLPNSRERIWLGSYDTPEKAARAFDAALFCLRGNKANFNFPNNPPPPQILTKIGGKSRSLSSSEIQILAAKFANEEEFTLDSEVSSSGYSSSSTNTTTYSPAPSSSYTDDHHRDNLITEWSSFLDLLPSSSSTGFSELDDLLPNEFLMTPQTEFDHYVDEESNGFDEFFQDHQSFLWNF